MGRAASIIRKGVGIRDKFKRIAEKHGIAIAVIDGAMREVFTANDNSICKTLNPDGVLSPQCAQFCGKAYEKTAATGKAVRFVCHAGLECRAFPMRSEDHMLAAVVGRTFTRSENYRRAGARATSGDWKGLDTSALFEHVLMTGSSDQVEAAFELAREAAAELSAEVPAGKHTEPGTEATEPTPAEQPPKPPDVLVSRDDAGAWRSLYGSLLERDYRSACEAVVDFVAEIYGIASLGWLTAHEGRFRKFTARGRMNDSNVRIGIDTADARLVEAVENERPLVLTERTSTGKDARSLCIFPLRVGTEITSALAVLDPIEDLAMRRQIVRLCSTIAPRIEILRLRAEVAGRDDLVRSVRRFTDSLRNVDTADFWSQLAINSAELMQSEKASIMVYDEAADRFVIKAAIGTPPDALSDPDPGRRVSRTVFERGTPAVVSNITTSGLGPLAEERRYRTSSFISSPIVLGDKKLAVINFTDKASGTAFDRSDLELLQAVGSHIAIAIDRIELREKAGEFEQLSVTDTLTGLLNRRYIEQRLLEEVKRSNRHGYPMSFLMIDVDNFKSYNDTFGHPAGDEALKLVAHHLKETLRSADVAARFGGEEFAILLPQTTSEEAMAIAERVRAGIAAAIFPHREVTVSIGAATCLSESCAAESLIHEADQALYAAKHRGRNAVVAASELDKQDGTFQ